jgi:methionyl-tRNA formyltransferase
MYMSEWMDEWDILKIEEVVIWRDDTTQDIFDKFEQNWPEVLINTLKKVLSGEITWQKQIESESTYCSKIEKQDGQIDFQKPAETIYNQFKAYKNWPWVFSQYKGKKFSIEECNYENIDLLDDHEFKIWDVVEYSHKEKDSIWILCNPGILFLQQIKLEWKKSMDINSFINGNKDFLDYNFVK